MARLDNIQKMALKEAINGIDGQFFLFGSRVDDDKRGGDVDLLVISENIEKKLDLKIEIMTKYQSICDEKIDVVILPNPDNMNNKEKSFFNIINKVNL